MTYYLLRTTSYGEGLKVCCIAQRTVVSKLPCYLGTLIPCICPCHGLALLAAIACGTLCHMSPEVMGCRCKDGGLLMCCLAYHFQVQC